MKKIFLALTFLFSALISFGQVQDGGAVQARNNAYVRGQIGRNNDQLKVWDSAVYNKLVAGVSVTNFPTSFLISNFPAIQPVSQSGSWTVSVSNFPSSFSISNFPSTQPVTQSGTWNVGISGTLPAFAAIPSFKIDQTTPGTTNKVDIGTNGTVTANAGTNLNTSALALESGGNLASINTKTPALGQAVAGSSVPVVLPAAQITTLTPPAAITGFALEAGHLNNLDTKTPSLGQTTMSASQPVVYASDFLVTKITGQSAQTATVNNILTTSAGSAAIDVSNFRSFSVQVVSTGTGGTYSFEGSNDNVNFQVVPVYPQSSSPTSQTVFTASASQFIFYGGCSFNYLRLRIVTTITGGSLQAFTTLFPWPLSTTITGVGNGTSGLSIGTVNTISQILATAVPANNKTNATVGAISSWPMLNNGTSWDLQHGNWNTTTGDAGAKVAAGNGATQTNYDSRGAEITVLFSATSGTFTTMQFQLQYSFDAGTTWKNFGPATTNNTTPSSTDTYTFIVYPTNTSQAAGTTPVDFTTSSTQTVRMNAALPRTWRITWNVAGTSPSVTITGVYVNYQL